MRQATKRSVFGRLWGCRETAENERIRITPALTSRGSQVRSLSRPPSRTELRTGRLRQRGHFVRAQLAHAGHRAALTAGGDVAHDHVDIGVRAFADQRRTA